MARGPLHHDVKITKLGRTNGGPIKNNHLIHNMENSTVHLAHGCATSYDRWMIKDISEPLLSFFSSSDFDSFYSCSFPPSVTMTQHQQPHLLSSQTRQGRRRHILSSIPLSYQFKGILFPPASKQRLGLI
ncbi:hypothetical protein PRUPE_3G127500 [Prunus persica]|uniref:Uncharacterized protein n=1 Tax=Prunus persica TaxID=3760 RepID=A0A251PZ83_PRUPE|nr:hypothetical protein PRUPE_3G127500 [Prunus persica]ONI16887.1 hypothetical protein PRUPE_3G127500 [Prunus persica]ONI16888.1 hypothetical protein PRUPE_3G127500 [Prunus persica]